MATRLVPCTSCGCHYKASEWTCPHCGETVNRGVPTRTAAAVLAGLTTMTALGAACGGAVETEDQTNATATSTTTQVAATVGVGGVYGVASTAGVGGTGGMGGGSGGDGGN